MASPSPSAPVPEVEVPGSDAAHEVKPATNGHLPSETKSDVPVVAAVDKVEVEQPLLNGNGEAAMVDPPVAKVEIETIVTEANPIQGSPEATASTGTSDEIVTESVPVKRPDEATDPSATTEDEVMKDASQPETTQPPPTAELAAENPVESVEKTPETLALKQEETKTETSPAVDPAPADTIGAEASNAGEGSMDIDMGGTAAEASAPSAVEDDTLPTSEVDLGPAGMSQLAIDGTEADISTITSTADVSLGDAPTKVAREREDDPSEEPAPKRARTEPKEEEITAPVTGTDAMDATPAEPAPLESIEALPPTTPSTHAPDLSSIKWDDAEKDRAALSSYQRREIRKALAKSKKTKSGMHFRDSVEKLWPALWDTYVAKIEKPTDLGKIDRNLREPESPYNTFGDVKADLGLVFTNTRAFNGAAHDVTLAALNAVKTIWNDIKSIPEEEPAKPKAFPKAKPVREPRVAAPSVATPESGRRQSTGPGTSTASATSKAPPMAKSAADSRRDSIVDPDRPKRTVRAPKPKDIDYTSKSRKKLKPELQFCDEVLTEITSKKHWAINQFFLEPVDPVALAIPQYYQIIKKPMDFNEISRRLHGGEISTLKEFDKHVRLIFDNCFQFNGPPDQGNAVSVFAKQLKDMYEKEMKKKDAWLTRYAAANAPASNPSDDEDEDEDEEDHESASQAAEMTSNIHGLEAKLREEAAKLTDLYAADDPDQLMIQVQQGIVSVVQQTLLEKKQKLRTLKQHGGDKVGKKAKGTKAKASGQKKAAGAAAPKKAGVSKKPTKKSLNAQEKDQIANAINDLEGKHLDRAIDIIKNDTGQNENPEGELELDIDQLSPAALLKLWDLCKKVLPGFAKGSAAVGPPEDDDRHGLKNAAPKGKKNKPMSAQEQEARIAQLEALSSMYKRPSDGGEMEPTQAPTPNEESSDESSSEEE